MKQAWTILFALSTALQISAPSPAAAADRAIRFGGVPCELILGEVSDRAVRIQLFQLDAGGRPRPAVPSTVLVDFAAVEKLRVRELDGVKRLQAGSLQLELKAQPLTISVRRADGRPVQELVFDAEAGTNAGVTFRTAAPVFGLGEGAQQFDRRGAFYPMEPSWGGWNRPVLGSVVPSPFLIGTEGWALFAHRPEGQFDLREGKGRFLPFTRETATNGPALATNNASLDLFFMSLDEPADALAEYNRLTGRPVMPPKWALGYFQSHRTLTGPEQPLQIARAFREKQLPCDALIYLGTGYCPNGWNTGHGSLSFNTNAFDHPAEQVQALHDLDFRIILHVNRAPRNLFGTFSDPTLTADTLSPSDGQRGGVRGRPLHIRNYWARHRALLELGVDGWWPDDGDELPLEARLTRHRCYYEGPLQDRPNVRPWSLHRTGYAGSQRYGGWIWSGDINGRWETLAAQVAVGLNHGLSLTPFWGTDTGGFYPSTELTGELYARWFQFSTFCALFRSHGRTWQLRLPWGWNTGDFGPIEHGPADQERRGYTGDRLNPPQHPSRTELRNPEIERIARTYLELRYRLLPYNYTLAREACDTGLPLMRALWLHYPGDPEAVRLGSEYLWGRDFLVAPVVEKGLTVRRVYLPEGNWYDWWTGNKVAGKQWIERPVDLATLPLYVRAGAIIPLDPVRQFTGQAVSDPTTVRVHPGANGAFTLYDDDGQGLGYRDGSDPKMVWIHFRWDDAARRLTLEPDARMKKWPGGAREFNVEAAGAQTPGQRVEFRGERVSLELR